MLAAIFILSLALIVIVFFFSHVVKNLHSKSNTRDLDLKKNTDLLSETRQKAVKMIDEANGRALDIINKANLSTDIASENFREEIARVSSAQIKEFEKATSDFMKLYSQTLQDLKSNNMEVFQNVSKDIEVSTTNEIKNFKESMEKLTVLSQKEVKSKIDKDYAAAIKTIANYKNEELEKIDNGIYGLLEKISRLVLGKALNLSEHEDLILESLEKSKKEGVFK